MELLQKNAKTFLLAKKGRHVLAIGLTTSSLLLPPISSTSAEKSQRDVWDFPFYLWVRERGSPW